MKHKHYMCYSFRCLFQSSSVISDLHFCLHSTTSWKTHPCYFSSSKPNQTQREAARGETTGHFIKCLTRSIPPQSSVFAGMKSLSLPCQPFLTFISSASFSQLFFSCKATANVTKTLIRGIHENS